MMVTSRLGEGSEFTFSIPLEKASSGSLGSYASSQLTPEAAALDGAKARVLVVEDNAVNRLLVSDYPAAHGFKIDVAVDGVEAVSKARAILPDVILMDIQLPRRDGLSATRELKADPATRGIHVVALTALAMKGDAERCLEAGCDSYLSKHVIPPTCWRPFILLWGTSRRSSCSTELLAQIGAYVGYERDHVDREQGGLPRQSLGPSAVSSKRADPGIGLDFGLVPSRTAPKRRLDP